jgi:spore photoproduct lyase
MQLSKLYIDHQIADAPLVASIQAQLNLPGEIVKDKRDLFALITADPDPVRKGKSMLFLTLNRGAFIKDCPGTRCYRCCGYKILNIGTFCTMDCTYCILQSYFDPPLLQYFVNHDEMYAELDKLFSQNTVFRVGTGEFTDSMIWEKWTPISKLLVPKFSEQSRAVLELKTKSTAIKGLKDITHHRKTVVAWSLNTKSVIREEERYTASLSSRLEAAARCESWGYPIAFHFDPMVIYDGCEEDYREVVAQLFSSVSSENVAWISLGSFRFMSALKPIIQRRFPDSRIVYGEFVPGLDGKMRYFKPLRIDLYRKMVSWIRDIAPDVCLYFCMEDDEVWEKALGFVPSDRGGLSKMLDDSAVRHCGLDAP